MKLYTHKLSPFSAKVRIALDEKKVPCEEVALPISRTAVLHKPPEMLAINPRGQVPVLVDGDVRLYDSTVILEYLEDRYPEPPLYPRDLAARARARQIEDEGDWLMNTCMAELIAELYRKTDPATRDAARIERASVELGSAFDRLERELEGSESEHFAGEFGAADISVYPVVRFALAFGVPPGDARPRRRDWLERMEARPSVRREIDSMTAALQALPA
jgi:glutathione S-transferase